MPNRSGWKRTAAVVATVTLTMAGLSACGSDDGGTPTLIWYTNPDPNPPPGFAGAFGQAGIAERCSTDEYTITTQVLPQSATEQRIQLLRRLAAEDSAIDLMSLDTVFTAEFADAGYLADIPQDLSDGVLRGAVNGATWDGKLAVAPFWSNVQTLWFRKSMAQAAGLDMTRPVTWDQIIDAAASKGGKVGVQANKYEGYVVWLNALIQGAGGSILADTAAGSDAEVTIDTPAGRAAAAIVQKLAESPAAQADLSVSNEGTVLGPFAKPGGFMVNWTFIYAATKADEATFDDLGWAPYPRTDADKPSRAPIGGINIGVSAFSEHPEQAQAAVRCITSVANQARFAIETGQMPASESAYADAELREQFPADLLELWLTSIDSAGPRPPSPYWGTIVGALLNDWHPANSVGEKTPTESATFIRDVLSGKALL